MADHSVTQFGNVFSWTEMGLRSVLKTSCWITERTTIRASVGDVERTPLIAIGLRAAHQTGQRRAQFQNE